VTCPVCGSRGHRDSRSGAARPELNQRRWKKKAAWVKQRDRNACVLCGAREGRLVVHHLVRPQDGGTDVSENLVTLCTACHGRQHAIQDICFRILKANERPGAPGSSLLRGRGREIATGARGTSSNTAAL
jgi:5-methylcytosine-specific restriction endonuclease McrA